jgi:hypothetical protein
MNSDELKQLIKQYKKPGARKPAHKPTMRQAPVASPPRKPASKPTIRQAPITSKPRMPRQPAPAPRQPDWDWQAKRRADNERYAQIRQQMKDADKRLDISNMTWVTIEMTLASRYHGGPSGKRQAYTGLRIGDEPYIAIRENFQGPGGTTNKFNIYSIRTGKLISWTHGTRVDIYKSLKRTLETQRQNETREQEYARQRAHETLEKKRREKIAHAANHGHGFYIMPFYSLPEIAGKDEASNDLYGEPEGDCLGPFHLNPDEPASDAEDMTGIQTSEDLEDYYIGLLKTLPANHPPFVIIEAQSRKDALNHNGHEWFVNGLSKGPPVDPRQTGFTWSK